MVYEYPTNYSNGSSVTGPGSFFLDYPAAVVSNYAGGIVTLVFLLMFAISSPMGVKKGLLSSLFITGMLSVYLAARGWLNPIVPFGFGAVLVIVLIIGMFEGKGGAF